MARVQPQVIKPEVVLDPSPKTQVYWSMLKIVTYFPRPGDQDCQKLSQQMYPSLVISLKCQLVTI